jgi:adenylate kinase family enzyme
MKKMKMVKVFVLGRSGTGKSTAARLMAQIVREYEWHAQHIDDYSILYSMYRNDQSGRFRRASDKFDGFDIRDPTVLDEALTILSHRVDFALTRVLDRTKLVIIEFARSTYKTSLEQFGFDFLKESYFLFLSSDMQDCIKRIEHRAKHPVYEGDRFISEKAMKDFYSSDDIPATRAMLRTVYKLDNSRIRVIYNVSSEEVFLNEVRRFIEWIILQEIGS